MYIKYLNNIHNIENYYSIIQSESYVSTLNLVREGDSIYLQFEDEDTKHYILSKIWDYLTNGQIYFDIDEEVKVYKETKKYNL